MRAMVSRCFPAILSITAFLTACGGTGSTSGGTTTPPSMTNEWTWMGGSKTVGARYAASAGVYGTIGVASAANVPPGREFASSWTDSSGNLWLFGGLGVDASGAWAWMNDLWEFNPAARTWTWVSGSSTPSSGNGVYGTEGVPAASNVPDGRFGAVSWIDSNSNLWLFGGVAQSGFHNDLWQFNPSTKEWTWISGGDTGGVEGGDATYGSEGVAAPGNVPGAREAAANWIDADNNLWLFGGDQFNDLWEFSSTTKMWTWISGSSPNNSYPECLPGVYGTPGVAAVSNVPSDRGTTTNNSTSWTDSSGNLWLFGGLSCTGYLNDLWEFSPATGMWTWVSGSNTVGAGSVYGTMGTGSAANVPGARSNAISWIDTSGNLWLFGGEGQLGVQFNDLWIFDPTAKTWTWMSGSDVDNASGVYGTLGSAAAANVPGGRVGAASWRDSSGNLWLFGGLGYDSTGTVGYLNDLWRYEP